MCQWNRESWGSEPRIPQIQLRIRGASASPDRMESATPLSSTTKELSCE